MSTIDFTASPAALRAPQAVELPSYLVDNYDWAYLWPISVWFFDHQPIINTILFGNYRRIMNETMRLMKAETAGKTLQIAAVYGELTPTIAKHVDDFHLIDVAKVQLRAARRKLKAIGKHATLTRMRAERLRYDDASFDTTVVFFLLHELPTPSRHAALTEAIRVTRPGGQIMFSEYGEHGNRHWFHRFQPFRAIITWAEPFLSTFWKENLTEVLETCAASIGRRIELEEGVEIFGGFYRVRRYRVA